MTTLHLKKAEILFTSNQPVAIMKLSKLVMTGLAATDR